MSQGPVSSTISNSLYAGGGLPGTLTTTTGIIADSSWSNAAAVFQPKGCLELKGEEADIIINGVSLSETLQGIQRQLGILSVNPKLEAEWDQLRELGDQYRQLEAELLEKKRAWDILRKKPG